MTAGREVVVDAVFEHRESLLLEVATRVVCEALVPETD